ncbi:sensor histidine kinase [Rhizohabitans arisaemae]|uniref:sensor histidine kinase n=1 Tax=Rhizohabitans arisaemae TaxID=2720610 RepID=UPI0024B0FAE5|nr:HAMP domain-containing sensor histidine kinase [Rhizohabitans arisaemae]
MRSVGLRARIALSMVGLALLGVTVLGLLVHTRVAGAQLHEARAALDRRLVETVHADLQGQATELSDAGLPAPLRAEVVKGGSRLTYLDGSTLWAATKVGDRVVALSRPYAPERAALADLDQALIWSGVVAAALASLAGFAIATGLSRRIRRAAGTATRVAAGDLAARVGRSGRDEVALLGRALDRMADSLQARLEAERRVTADIAHELRTPVTGLVTAAELLPPGRPSELVRDRVAVLRRLVEDVIEVARLDTATESADVSEFRLGVLARRVAGDGPGEVRVIEDAVVATDRRRVERVLGNLLANARRHGAEPVEVVVEGARVTVRDHGRGFSPELLADGPQRFRTGARERGSGTGLGLTIALGQARVLGATLSLSNAEDGGALATLDLSASAVSADELQ